MSRIEVERTRVYGGLEVIKMIKLERKRIKKDLLAIADYSELEDLRREVVAYFKHSNKSE